MGEKEETLKENDKEVVQMQASNIVKDKRQVRVTIPADFVELLEIDVDKDVFAWAIVTDSQHQISLEGRLVKNGKTI